MRVIEAWNEWWEELGHVARCNRDPARTREAFEAGYLAALGQLAASGNVQIGQSRRRLFDLGSQGEAGQ